MLAGRRLRRQHHLATPLGQTIGGTASGAGNLISGNAQHRHAAPVSASSSPATRPRGNVVAGNLIGLDAGGNVVSFAGGYRERDGHLRPELAQQHDRRHEPGRAERHLRQRLVGHPDHGHGRSTGNLVAGNFIGTNLTGYHFPNGSSEGSRPRPSGS